MQSYDLNPLCQDAGGNRLLAATDTLARCNAVLEALTCFDDGNDPPDSRYGAALIIATVQAAIQHAVSLIGQPAEPRD